MKVEELINTARSRTGLDDFGEDSFREGLERLVHSINAETRLNDLGKAGLPEMLMASLVNRLEVEHWYHIHPEIDEEQIVAPLFGVGLPRTGTTALIYMLARDPSTRTLRNWEAAKPCPPPEKATELTDPRVAAFEANLEANLERTPEMRKLLPQEASGPIECFPLMFMSFKFHAFEAMMHVPSYIEWVNSSACDMEPAYRYHQASAETPSMAMPSQAMEPEDAQSHALHRRPEQGIS